MSEPGESLGYSRKFVITAGSATAMVFPAPGMDGKGKYRSVFEIEHVEIYTDQELYALKVCGRLIYSGVFNHRCNIMYRLLPNDRQIDV